LEGGAGATQGQIKSGQFAREICVKLPERFREERIVAAPIGRRFFCPGFGWKAYQMQMIRIPGDQQETNRAINIPIRKV
jgi:hypothetical protein